MNYRIGYIDIKGTSRTVRIKAHGMQQAIHRFFDQHSPVMEVLLVAKE